MDWFTTLIGHDLDALNWWQMSSRGLICFVLAMVLIRGTGKRIFGKNTALDIMVSIIIGSNISRAITGNAPFFPTLITTVLVVVLHNTLAYMAWRYPSISNYLKGRGSQLICDGEEITEELQAKRIGPGDLEEAMRLQGLDPDLSKIRYAYLERNGELSIIID